MHFTSQSTTLKTVTNSQSIHLYLTHKLWSPRIIIIILRKLEIFAYCVQRKYKLFFNTNYNLAIFPQSLQNEPLPQSTNGVWYFKLGPIVNMNSIKKFHLWTFHDKIRDLWDLRCTGNPVSRIKIKLKSTQVQISEFTAGFEGFASSLTAATVQVTMYSWIYVQYAMQIKHVLMFLPRGFHPATLTARWHSALQRHSKPWHICGLESLHYKTW